MKKLFASLLETRRKYKKFKKTNKTYKVARYSLMAILSVYGLILLFPQFLFAHNVEHKNFSVYMQQPLEKDVIKVLDAAEAKLERSPIYDKNSTQKIFVFDSHGLYKFITLKGFSFASTIPVVGHIRINKADFEKDLVLRDSEEPNRRSLSGVVAHEITHNQISKSLGIAKYLRTPKWKDEGYCEYIAGETTISFEEGVKLWKENPEDSSKYDYFKYHQMVKYLLDVEKISVEDLFEKDFDAKELEKKVYVNIIQKETSYRNK